MAKIISENISDRICQIVDEFCGGNNSLFGKTIEESEANVRNYKNGKTPPKYKALVKIAINYDISLEWLLLGRGTMKHSLSGNQCPQNGIETGRIIQLEKEIDRLRARNEELAGEVALLRHELNDKHGNPQESQLA